MRTRTNGTAQNAMNINLIFIFFFFMSTVLFLRREKNKLMRKLKQLLLLFTLAIVVNSCQDDDSVGLNENRVANLSYEISYQWSETLMQVERYAENTRPVGSARALAYIHLAAYETALPGMPNHTSNSGKIPDFFFNETVLPSLIDWRVALNECYAQTIRHFMWSVPEQYMSVVESLEKSIDDRLRTQMPANLFNRSEVWGRRVAHEIIAYSKTDLSAERQILDPQPRSYQPPVGPGLYIVEVSPFEDALFPYWGEVRTFIADVDETESIEPIPYSADESSAYYQEMLELYTKNNRAREENNEDLWIAEFWSDDTRGMTFSPPLRLEAIANQLILEDQMNLETVLELKLKLGFALNDAGVNCWEDKYKYNTERPNHFIHRFIDPTFETNLNNLNPWPNPTFPGYPSGHSTFASVGAGVMNNYFGFNRNFTDNCHLGRQEFISTPRSFNSLDEAARENAFSRVPLGVHIRQDCIEGIRLGYEVAEMVNQYSLEK